MHNRVNLCSASIEFSRIYIKIVFISLLRHLDMTIRLQTRRLQGARKLAYFIINVPVVNLQKHKRMPLPQHLDMIINLLTRKLQRAPKPAYFIINALAVKLLKQKKIYLTRLLIIKIQKYVM